MSEQGHSDYTRPFVEGVIEPLPVRSALLERMRSDILIQRGQTGERPAEPPGGEVWAEVLPPDWTPEDEPAAAGEEPEPKA